MKKYISIIIDFYELEKVSADEIGLMMDDVAEYLSDHQITKVCETLLNANGDVIWAIYNLISSGFWDDNVKDPELAILEAKGNRAFTLALCQCEKRIRVDSITKLVLESEGDQAKAAHMLSVYDLWDDSIKPLTNTILEAKGDQAIAIAHSKIGDKWDGSVKEPCKAILESQGDVSLAVCLMKCQELWDDSVADACDCIVNLQGNRLGAVELAIDEMWWKFSLDETFQIIKLIKDNVWDITTILAKNDIED